MSKVIVLSDAEIEKVLDEKSVITAVEGAYRQKSDNRAAVWPMVFYEFEPGAADMDIKSGCLEDDNIYGLKLVSLHVNNKEAGLPELMGTTLIFNMKTGEPEALVNAGYITKLRTGAAGAIGVKSLARKDSKELFVIGMGAMVPFQIAATLIAMPGIERVTMIEPVNPEKSAGLVDGIREIVDTVMLRSGIKRTAVLEGISSMEEGVRRSDVIITMTPSRKPMIQKEWVKPGTHFSCVGSDMRGKQEIDGRIFENARVFVDDLEQAVNVGECEIPIKEGLFSKENIIAEIGDLLNGKVKGRISDEEITIFDSTGIALQDLTVAALALREAKEKGMGCVVEV